ncbi:MAG: phosphotransferase [Candidatus Omnitrophica bacterium]|nr:phosphotransferase [Candidatus Omnitrophota bacterium]
MNNLKTHLICLECPNGCNLNLDWKADHLVAVSGNECAKGIVFVSHTLKKKHNAHIVVEAASKHFSKEVLSQIVSSWDLVLSRLHYDIMIQGSPERSVFRVVIEDDKKDRYLLEEIAPKTLKTKQKIVQTLDFLFNKNLRYIQPFLKNKNNDCIISHQNKLWQMTPFIKGASLDRREYMYDYWRGDLLADFLIELKKKTQDGMLLKDEKQFSIKKYVYRLLREIKAHQKDIKREVDAVVCFLEKEFMAVHDELPVCFCHGDYHPMNIVWGDNKIEYVIDWEFLGNKPEIYDVCNLIGCVGVEHPSSLYEGLIIPFIKKIRDSKIFSDISFQYLVEFIVALRFAWLSEWLRRKDHQMIELELAYMNFLIEHKEDLEKVWGI